MKTLNENLHAGLVSAVSSGQMKSSKISYLCEKSFCV